MRMPDARECVLLLDALRATAWARTTLSVRGLDRARARIAAVPASTPADLADMREVAWSVRHAARLVPKATCLTQALAGQLLLAERGRRSEIRISAPLSEERFSPHAWLLCETYVVLGGTAAEYRIHRALAAYPNTGAVERLAGLDSPR